jgi:YggT family protein
VHAIGYVIEIVLWFYLALLMIRLVVGWVQMFARSWQPTSITLVVLEGVYTATEPAIRAIRRVRPPFRLGSVALDLSLMLVLIVCYLALNINRATLLSS